MVTENSPAFQKYLGHVRKWEGLTSANPADTAAACAPWEGAVHTNRGVTYCTFREFAGQLGIEPVTYQRFLQLTDQDMGRFVLLFMNRADASELPTLVALSVTEAAWMSGPKRAVKHLQRAVNSLLPPDAEALAVDGIMGPKTRAAVAMVDPGDLYRQYWKERSAYLEYLIANGYQQFARGWRNRVADFLKIFPFKAAAIGLGSLVLIGLGLWAARF